MLECDGNGEKRLDWREVGGIESRLMKIRLMERVGIRNDN